MNGLRQTTETALESTRTLGITADKGLSGECDEITALQTASVYLRHKADKTEDVSPVLRLALAKSAY